MDAKEEIRSKLNIEDVIGEYVQLKRAGRNFKGLSPFGNEKTPSFVVSPDKHIWHDFSSNRGGDVFSFIMEMEGLDFRAAMELLARKAGVDLTQFQNRDNTLTKKKQRLYNLLDLAKRFYQQNLIRNPLALEYVFKRRGFTKEIVQQFAIGYAPNAEDGLLRALKKRGFTEEEAREAGVVAIRRRGAGDMFRGRVMIPLCDAQGRVVGFTARILVDQPSAPKYINTPQTLLYDKGRQVFGLHLAKEAIRKTGYAVIVEGNLDVVSSHQADVAQVVATAGTAITEYHLRSLERITHDIRLCFDGDKAGILATERAIGIASTLGIKLSIITLPEKIGDVSIKDTDDLVRTDPEQWKAAIEQPQDAIEWLVNQYERQFDLQTAAGKRQATTQAIAIIRQIADPVEQEYYIQYLSTRTGASVQALQAKMGQSIEKQAPALKPYRVLSVQPKDPYLHQDHLLALLIEYPELRDEAKGKLVAEDFMDDQRQEVYRVIEGLALDPLNDMVVRHLQSDDIRVKIRELQLIAEQKYATLEDSLYFAVAELVKRVLIDKKTKQKDKIAKIIADASDEATRRQLSDIYTALIKEIQALRS